MISAAVSIAIDALFVASAIGAAVVLADSAVRGLAAARRLRRELQSPFPLDANERNS